MKRARLLVAATVIAAVVLAQGCLEQPPTFVETFDTVQSLDRFDFGYSGPNPWDWGNGSGQGAITSFHGDHNTACEGPDTDRDVAFGGDRTRLVYDQLFWWCAPKGPQSGHLMTGVDTISYNIGWFSPKDTFTDVQRVCWDQNLTEMSHRKWTQVLFVGPEDAVRYPSSRGTGGFDLGFTSPDFRSVNGPSTGVEPKSGTLAGFKSVAGDARWFQNDNNWTTSSSQGAALHGVTDKAARYKNCLIDQEDGRVTFVQFRPGGESLVVDLPGQIPQGPVRVVFQDDNYDPPKDSLYDPNVLTWHWDDIQITTTRG